MFDVAILGAGVSGSALAYQLSRFHLDVVVLEKENDVSLGASRANTAIVHGGYDPPPDTLMGHLNVDGARMCMELVDRLDVEFRKTGSLIVAFDDEDMKEVHNLYDRGLQNGVPSMEILDGEEVSRREPNLSKEIIGALWVPESGVINPWEFTLAMMEVAVREGVELKLCEKVIGLKRQDEGFLIETERGTYSARYVVNATGVHSEEIHNMVAEPAFHIHPTRGQYYLLDRSVGEVVNSVVFQCPSPLGKGVLVSPTIHYNTLVGPDSEVVEDCENTSTTREALDDVARQAKRSVPSLQLGSNIRNFAGVRANSDYGDFYIKISAPYFLDIAAIKSPGLTCAPRIATYAIELLREAGLDFKEKETWDGTRSVVRFKEIPEEQREAFIRENPLYGRVICRCETITEGEIVAAIHRPITPVSLDGIKRRAGTGMGRCQSGFCGPRVLEILARETGKATEDILQDKEGSHILIGDTKEGRV